MPRIRTIAIWGGFTAMALALGVLLLAASGIYNIGASAGHLTITSWFLEFGMRRSVATHSMGITSPRLDDPDMIRLGAAHYHVGCAICHGAPGQRPFGITQSLPAPPDLVPAVARWKPEQLFWIVKHGIKYTAMPAWMTQARDDEVWTVVAFLQKLPGLGAEEYRRLATGNLQAQHSDADELAGGGASRPVAACTHCHGDRSAPPASRLVPKLAGLSAAYLELALSHYLERSRESGIMGMVATELDDGEIRALAAYYAALPREQGIAGADAPPVELLERGRQIATSGVPANGVPACLPCHGSSALPAYPRLEGQHAPYMIAQLKLWQQGQRDRSTLGRIMAPIAKRLSVTEIEAVSAYFESLTMPPQASASRSRD